MNITLDLSAINYDLVRSAALDARVSEPHIVGCIIRLLRDFLPVAGEGGTIPHRAPFIEMRMAGTEYYTPVIPALRRVGVVELTDEGFIRLIGVKSETRHGSRECSAA